MHRRVDAMQAAPRCGARTRSGAACMAPAAHGKGRCRMHGGALGSGAPLGNRNAWKHGFWSGVSGEERQGLRALLREAKMTLRRACR